MTDVEIGTYMITYNFTPTTWIPSTTDSYMTFRFVSNTGTFIGFPPDDVYTLYGKTSMSITGVFKAITTGTIIYLKGTLGGLTTQITTTAGNGTITIIKIA